jgi:Core-2/I-Branching enzyme
MRIAYLILVHRNPRLLKRAIETLSSEDCGFFIHVDRKVNIQEFSAIYGNNVFFSEQRISVHWGEFSQVEATMQLMRQALACSANYEYFVFLQGSDYPLRSSKYIRVFLRANRGKEFISLVKMPAAGYPLSKINNLRYPSATPVLRFITRIMARLGLAQRDHRRYLGGLQAYAGQAWWTLSRQACCYILEFAACNPHLEKYFRNAFTSDEMFFHTILGNSPFGTRVRRNLTYVDWSVHGDHPTTLTDGHVTFFEAQEKVWLEDEWGSGEALFARKFSDDNLDLLDRIDQLIGRKDELTTTFPRVNS